MRILPLLLCGLVAVGIIAFLFRSGPETSGTHEVTAAKPAAQSADSPITDAAASSPAAAIPTPPLAAAMPAVAETDPLHPLRHTIQRVVSEQWIDAPQKLAGRQRVRIVEAKFKYPRLRLEESVTADPSTGLEKITLLRASVADHVMVGLKPGVTMEQAAAAIQEKGYAIRAVEEDSFLLAELPQFDQATDQTQAARDIAALEEFIDHAEPDYIVFPCLVPNDPAYSQGKLWGLHNPGNAAGTKSDADIDAPEAWDIRSDASSIVVAVTDTGIQYNHQDLAPNMWVHPTNGSFGFDAYDDDNDPMDVGGHGTHCAGTIGGRGNNGIGMTGVAWQVKLMGVRFLGPDGGSTSDSIRSVNYARQNGAHIISASWGGGGFSQSLYNAIKACGDAGIPFVAAAGNSSTNNDSTPHYPSSYDLDTIVSVASTTSADTLSPFSCFGRNSVDIAAPGSDIWSAYIGSNTTYKSLNGTSMATPHVSGALALAMAQFPTENVRGMIRRLYASVDKISSLSSKCKTGGRLNLAKLLGSAATPPEPDAFATAHRFDGYYGEWFGSNEGATRETDEDLFDISGSAAKSLWFAFRTPHSGLVTLDFNSDVPWYSVVIYEGSVQSNLKLLQISDLFGGFNRKFTFTSKADTEYRILLATNHETRQLFLVKYGLTPPNDMFSDATIVNGEIFSVTSNNRSATTEPFEKNQPHAKGGQGKSVWWRWTAPVDMNVTLNTRGSAFDTVMAVYTGSSSSSLTEVAANDDRNSLDWTSQVQFAATAGTTYYIAVDSFREDAAGDITLNGFRSGTLTILRQPVPVAVELGKRAVFEVSALSNSDLTYQWFLNGQSIPGQTSSNIVIDPVRTVDLGNYSVEVRNSENLVTSNTAALSEKQIAPKLTWSSGNQAVASGTAVNLSANFSGSTPLTFSWTKNGQAHPGATSSLTFPSTQVADAGIYQLTATNSAGSATVDFTLSVIQSPWDRWEWRRAGIPNAAITDIKVHDGEAFAVSATTLLRSSDGIRWSKSVFPNGFTGHSITKAGTKFICLGTDISNTFRIALSTDNAATWTISTPVGFAITFQPEKSTLVSHNGAFIAYNSISNQYGQDFLRSTDGINWTRLTATNLTGATINLAGRGRIASDGTTLVLASITSSSNGRMRYFRSPDGSTWQEYETNNPATTGNGSPMTAFFDGSTFYLFGIYSIGSSPDGVNWQYTNAPSNGFEFNSHFASNGETVISFGANSQTMRYFSNPSDRKMRTIQPANSHAFTAAASFGSKVLFGTDKGMLDLVDGPLDVSIPNEKSTTIESIEFTENLFIARTTNGGSNAVSDQVSGDGITWKPTTLLDATKVTITGSAFGKTYGTGFATSIYSGHNPFDLRLNPDDPIGVAPKISFIGQLPNGNALAVSTPSTGSASLLSRASGAASWTTASIPLTVNSALKFTALGNRWISSTGINSSVMHTSTNGTSWTTTNITAISPQFTSMGGKSWCVYQSASSPMVIRTAYSADGISWPSVATTGFPTGLFTSAFIKRLVAFGDYLVVVGTDENLYFSQDGSSWLRGFTPGKVVDIAAANGQLIAIMKNGGIIQTGTPHPGVSAPLVSITSPQTAGTHLVNSRVTIEGTVSDPEDGTASYTCYLDDQIVASGLGNSFRFVVTPSNLNGHTVTVRASDSHGLRQIDAIRLKVVPAEPENLLSAEEGKSYLPKNHATVVDGVFYVAGTRNVYRSLDGLSWQRVAIPSFANTIYAMASGNGSLVIQFDNGGIITTRDGVNWTHFQPNLTSYWVREPLRFESGMFIAAYQTQGTTSGSVMTSTDGLIWQTGAVSVEGYLAWSATNGTGTIIGAVAYQTGVYRTTDQGFNWIPVPQITSAGNYNSRGVYGSGKFVVVSTASGKLHASPDAITWSEQALPAGVSNMPALTHIGGLFFLGRTPALSYASLDGVNWQALSSPVDYLCITHSRGVFLAQSTTGGLVTSRDGISWQPVPSQGMPTTFSKIISSASTFLAIDENGGVWSSTDAMAWTSLLPGTPPANLPITGRIGRSIAKHNDKLVVSGSGIAVTSADDGRSWTNVSLDGLAPSTSKNYLEVAASGAELLLIESNSIVRRSTDATTFQTIPGLPVKTWMDLAWNGTDWMLIANDGTLMRSSNGGIAWTQVPTPGLLRASAVTWFNNRWVIFGSDLSGTNTPHKSFTLEAGDVFQMRASLGSGNSTSPIRTLIAHGRLIAWQRGDSAYVSSDALTWTAANLAAGAGNYDFDIHHTPTGFTAFVPSSTAYYPVRTWKTDTAGLVWQEVPSEFNNIQFSENLGNRIFLFASHSIAELHDKDLALTLPNLPAVTLGVGDQINTHVTIRNFGSAIPAGGIWKVRAWLAKNRFFGDATNTPLGTFEISSPMPAPGASLSYPVSFVLPNEIRTGANFLILSLSPPDGLKETNTPNNTVISDTAAITIPEWSFNVLTNGNGQVNRDFAAMRYPHKAQVSLTASAGKGATFTGWSGDGYSPNNQITILMDGNKTLAANFSNRATLQVFVRGAGAVNGLVDLGSYEVGQTASLTAAPAEGWQFSHWSGDTSSTQAVHSLIMTQPKTITAHFILPVATWKSQHFSVAQLADAAVSGDNQDPDGDGLKNWQEYLHASQPLNALSRGVTPLTIEAGMMRCLYTRNLGAVNGGTVFSQASRDLTQWNAPDLQERIISTVDGIETIEVRFPTTAPRGFLRMQYQTTSP
jgi:subtilisin family serine protease